VNTEKSLGCSNRCRDIVIFNLLGCRPSAACISLDLCNGPNSHEGRTASPCHISSKSVKPRPKIWRFFDFQDGGSRHLGFAKFDFCDDRDGQEGRNASSCQIASKSVEPLPRYGDFLIFQDGGRRHLGFLKFEIFNGRDAQEG